MRQVTYQMTFRDRLEGYRIGLAHMSLSSQITLVMMILMPLTFSVLNSISHHHLITWLLTTRFSMKVLEDVGLGMSITLSGCFMGGALVSQLTKNRTVTLHERHLVNKVLLGLKIHWRQVDDIVETAEHIFICHKVLTPVVVPKSAFPNKEQACAFVEQAELYWRRETGHKDPLPVDDAGVWPPAPLSGDSQELGEKPKR